MVAARAGTHAAASESAAKAARRPVVMALSLLQLGLDMLRMLLVALKDLQPGLQQPLQLRIAGGGDELGFQRVVHGLVVGDLVFDIGLVEGCALELVELKI